MSRLLLLTPAVVLLLASAPAAPVPKEKPKAQPVYYPLKLGAKWVYKVGDTEITTAVTEVNRAGGETVATVETLVNGKAVASEKLAVSEKGVFRTAINKAPINPPLCLIKYPHKAGEKWETVGALGGAAVRAAFQAGDVEEVTVPAGKYKAVRIDCDGVIGGVPTKVTSWFAPDVGIVKLSYAVAGSDAALELKSFTPGKE